VSQMNYCQSTPPFAQIVNPSIKLLVCCPLCKAASKFLPSFAEEHHL
jgi:hypothetical protein